jgi:two-component system response regulator HydG
MNRVVVIDDDREMVSLLSDFVSAQGYAVDAFSRAQDALQTLERQPDDYFSHLAFVVSDIRMPEVDGLTFVERFREKHNDIPVILATAFGSVESAIEAIRKGAFDYVTKPFHLKELSVAFGRASRFRALKSENQTLRAQIQKDWTAEGIIGKSPSMQAVINLLRRAAPTTAHVLITGESGTGKEIVARALHNMSPRKPHGFLAINCSAIPEALLESELFGHQKGAFTGATQNKAGLLADADKGTFFLDEIGDLSLSLQAKLLRFLQDKEIRPVGSNTPQKVDVRILAATHKDLAKGIRDGWFREDLFYRLNVIPLHLPPLRSRAEDVQLLAEHFIQKASANYDMPRKKLTAAALRKLMAYSWPGNVRQLENVIERAMVLAPGDRIDVDDLLELDHAQKPEFDPERAFGQMIPLKDLEAQYIEYVMRKVGGKREAAAKVLGISRRTLYRRDEEV